MSMLHFFVLFPLLVNAEISLWRKHYLTYSIENDIHLSKTVIDAIGEWNIKTLELEKVEQGQGDIKIYFENLLDHLGGTALLPEGGIIKINRNQTGVNITKIIQHEFAHSLGLQHSENYQSIMFAVHIGDQRLLESDKNNLNDLYKCRYDSVTLLNGQTYLKFKGRYYERVDLNTGYTTEDKIFSPLISKATTMFRNDTYFIISDNKYYEYNHSMHFLKEGLVTELFPNIFHNISAVLTLRNGSILCFLEYGYIWYDGIISTYQTLFNVFPDNTIQGAYSDFKFINLVEKDYRYIYDEDFNFLGKQRMCDDSILNKTHCCNDYSNI